MHKLLIVGILFLSSCGYSSRNNEVIGQVKKVLSLTPLICPERNDIDLSLGVIKNGAGSMSSQDLWMTVPNQKDLDILVKANESGTIVKIKYDDKRFAFCPWTATVTHAEIVE